MSDEREQNIEATLLHLEQQGYFPEADEPNVETSAEPETTEKPEAEETQQTEADDGDKTTPEATEPVTEETKPEPEKISPRLSELARRENALRKKEKELKDLEASLTKEPETKKFDKASDLLLEHGFTAEDLMNELLGIESSGDNRTDVNIDPRLAKKIENLEKETQSIKQKEEERAKQLEVEEQQRQAKIYADNLSNFIHENKSKYELTVATNNEQLVLDTLVEYYKAEGEELTWERAAEMVENYLETELAEKTQNLLAVGKLRNKLGIQIPDKEAEADASKEQKDKPQAETAPKQRESKTLTNKNTSSTMPPAADELDDEERLRQAKALEVNLFK